MATKTKTISKGDEPKSSELRSSSSSSKVASSSKPKTKQTNKALSGKYFEGLGRRKTAIARVRFYPGTGSDFIVNGLDYKEYFPVLRYQKKAFAPLGLAAAKGSVGIKVRGGGVMAQSEAVTLGLARALVKFEPEFKKNFRAFGYLTRDSRMVERKKFGLKKARRAPQWRKR